MHCRVAPRPPSSDGEHSGWHSAMCLWRSSGTSKPSSQRLHLRVSFSFHSSALDRLELLPSLPLSCTCMWPWRELEERKPRRHTGHLWGLLEAWVFMWILRWSLREKAESHSPQWYFLSPVCSFTCRSRLRLCLNRRLQKVQLKGSLSPWLCSWRLRKLKRLKDLSQNWHGYGRPGPPSSSPKS